MAVKPNYILYDNESPDDGAGDPDVAPEWVGDSTAVTSDAVDLINAFKGTAVKKTTPTTSLKIGTAAVPATVPNSSSAIIYIVLGIAAIVVVYLLIKKA